MVSQPLPIIADRDIWVDANVSHEMTKGADGAMLLVRAGGVLTEYQARLIGYKAGAPPVVKAEKPKENKALSAPENK